MFPTHLRRAMAAAALSAAALGLSTVAAGPAEAATTVKVSAFTISGGKSMSVIGTTDRDVITFNSGNPGVVLVATGNAATAGSGCFLLAPSLVQCGGITKLEAFGGSGNDEIRNNTSIAMGTNGGSGNDKLIGGTGRDVLNGGPDVDNADGRGGTDTCGGDEVRKSCEIVTS